MAGSARKRKQWKQIEEQASGLLASIDKVDEWIAPVWGVDGERDFLGKRAKTVECLEGLAATARGNHRDYERHGKNFSRRKNPDRESLYADVLRIWTDIAGGSLSLSNDEKKGLRGPLVRFFMAAVREIVHPDASPRVVTVKDIVKREKKRREKPTSIGVSHSTARKAPGADAPVAKARRQGRQSAPAA